jgi:hypothetical protein
MHEWYDDVTVRGVASSAGVEGLRVPGHPPLGPNGHDDVVVAGHHSAELFLAGLGQVASADQASQTLRLGVAEDLSGAGTREPRLAIGGRVLDQDRGCRASNDVVHLAGDRGRLDVDAAVVVKYSTGARCTEPSGLVMPKMACWPRASTSRAASPSPWRGRHIAWIGVMSSMS